MDSSTVAVPMAAATHAAAPARTTIAATTSTSAGMASATANSRRARAVKTSALVCGRRRVRWPDAGEHDSGRDAEHEHEHIGIEGGGER